MAFCSQSGNAGEHAKFLKSLAKFIQKHDADPQKVRVRSKSELLNAQTTLDVEQRSGTKRTRKMVFVKTDCWDEKAYVPLPQDKVVVENMDGQSVEGVWRDLDKSGHYHFEMNDDQSFRERRREVDGTGPFAAEELANVREACRTGLKATQSRREAVAVEAGGVSLESLMSVIENLPSGSSRAEPTGKLAPEKSDSEGSSDGVKGGDDDDDDDDDSGGEEDARSRLLSIFSGGQPRSTPVVVARKPVA